MINNKKPTESDVAHNIKYLLFYPYKVFCITSLIYGKRKGF